MSRRLGYLHDSVEAQAAVSRWLQRDGFLADLLKLDGEGFAVLKNVAPVVPEAILFKIRETLGGVGRAALLAGNYRSRSDLIGLTKALAYEDALFDDAAMTLAEIRASEALGANTNSAEGAFKSLFHLYLSGTRALPEQRRRMIRKLAASDDPNLRRRALEALDAMLEAIHFSTPHDFDFGARSRDFGWEPKLQSDLIDWYVQAVLLAVELKDRIDTKGAVAHHARGLWWAGGCQDALEAAALRFAEDGVWLDGWIAFRTALRFDGSGMPEDVRAQLRRIIDRLKPVGLVERVHALILERSQGGYSIEDGEEDDAEDFSDSYRRIAEAAINIGEEATGSPDELMLLIGEISMSPHAPRALEFDRGLARGAAELPGMWTLLENAYFDAEAAERNSVMLGGFLQEAYKRDPVFGDALLDRAIEDPALGLMFPYLQTRAGLEGAAITRLRRAASFGLLDGRAFEIIGGHALAEIDPGDVCALLEDILALPGGAEAALEILYMYVITRRDRQLPIDPKLIALGRRLLRGIDFGLEKIRRHGAAVLIRACLSGGDSEANAKTISENVRTALEADSGLYRHLGEVVDSLFKVQPFIALDIFVLGVPTEQNRLLRSYGFDKPSLVGKLDVDILINWAGCDPEARYNLVGRGTSMFETVADEAGQEVKLSDRFLRLLSCAPDKLAFLGSFTNRLHPQGWSGSLADVLAARLAAVAPLKMHDDASVRKWVADLEEPMASWIAGERGRDRKREESFE